MPALKHCFEAAGFEDVKTVISSGNVVFNAHTASITKLQKAAEASMEEHLGRTFLTIVRPVSALIKMLESDPYAAFRVPKNAKKIVTFLHKRPHAKFELPIKVEGAKIYCLERSEIFSAYVPSPHGPVFMKLIEKTFGQAVTTRTWQTVERITRA